MNSSARARVGNEFGRARLAVQALPGSAVIPVQGFLAPVTEGLVGREDAGDFSANHWWLPSMRRRGLRAPVRSRPPCGRS